MNKYLTTEELLGDLPPPLNENPSTSIVLGFLGYSSAAKWNRNSLTDLVMNPLIGALHKVPDSMLIPTEGATSTLLQVWGDNLHIEFQAVESDWNRFGRKARALRDGRILKESTHLVFFLGSRSDYYEKIAIREANKGKKVFAVDPKTGILEEWV